MTVAVYDLSEDTIRAGLELSAGKWGRIRARGTEEHLTRCFEVARRHGIKLENGRFRLEGELLKPSAPPAREPDSEATPVSAGNGGGAPRPAAVLQALRDLSLAPADGISRPSPTESFIRLSKYAR